MKLWQAVGMMAAFVVAVGVVLFLWWDLDVRWRPHDVTKASDQLAQQLAAAGWVSMGGGGANKVYLVAVRDCRPCAAFESGEIPALGKAGADVRVIMVDPNDASSTAPERATVAELWVNRGRPLLQAWLAADAKTWTAPGVPPADGDAARTAVVQASRTLADSVRAIARQNGFPLAYPLVVWRAKDGTLEAAAGNCPKTWRYVEKDVAAH